MTSSSLFSSLGAALQSFSSPRFSFKASSPTTHPPPSSSSASFSSSRGGSCNPGLDSFESRLCQQLERLKSTDEGGYLSVPWLCQAMEEVVLSTHGSAEAFVPDLQRALDEGDFKWLDEYLDDSVKLLDICRALRDAISEIKTYDSYVDLAIHSFSRPAFGYEPHLRRARNTLLRCIEAVKRKEEEMNQMGQRRSKLENCSSMLRRMGEKLNMEASSKGNFFMVIYAAQVSTIFICGVLASALSFKPRRPLSSIAVGGQSAWSFSLASLQQRVKEEIERKKSKGSNALLEELDKTDMAVRSLHAKVESLLSSGSFPLDAEQVRDIRDAVESLKMARRELRSGIEPLEASIGEVFKVLIASRVALLDIYSHSR